MPINNGHPIIQIKSGPRRARIPPEAAFSVIFTTVAFIYTAHGYDCVLTSGLEGAHGWSSEHFKGDAADFRTTHIKTLAEKKNLASVIADCLGDDFDVVFHEPGGDVVEHIHVEYDPKLPI